MIDKIREMVRKYLLRKKSLSNVLAHFDRVKVELNDFIAGANDDLRELEAEAVKIQSRITEKTDERKRATVVKNNIKNFLGE